MVALVVCTVKKKTVPTDSIFGGHVSGWKRRQFFKTDVMITLNERYVEMQKETDLLQNVLEYDKKTIQG
jgi:hypothetical protein